MAHGRILPNSHSNARPHLSTYTQNSATRYTWQDTVMEHTCATAHGYETGL